MLIFRFLSFAGSDDRRNLIACLFSRNAHRVSTPNSISLTFIFYHHKKKFELFIAEAILWTSNLILLYIVETFCKILKITNFIKYKNSPQGTFINTHRNFFILLFNSFKLTSLLSFVQPLLKIKFY